jgi:hypothetical protein
MTTSVVENADEGRYEIVVDGEVAGFTRVDIDGDVATFPHTEIASEFEGHGLASELIRGALDDVRSKGLRVVARCPFVRAFIDKNPEYQDLLAEN